MLALRITALFRQTLSKKCQAVGKNFEITDEGEKQSPLKKSNSQGCIESIAYQLSLYYQYH